MSVNFYTDNGFGQYPQLQKDIHDVKGKVSAVDALDKNIGKSIVESVPVFRRRSSLPEKLEGEDFIHAVQSHGWGLCSDVEPSHRMEKVLYAVDELTGFIAACAYVRP